MTECFDLTKTRVRSVKLQPNLFVCDYCLPMRSVTDPGVYLFVCVNVLRINFGEVRSDGGVQCPLRWGPPVSAGPQMDVLCLAAS